MARIVFVWEWGAGLGHLLPYRALIRALIEEGHNVSFIAPDLAAGAVLNDLLVNIIKTPDSRRVDASATPPSCLADIFHQQGMADYAHLESTTRRWLDLLNSVKPDLLIADFSPYALVANQILQIPFIASGIGFCLPPCGVPTPPFHAGSIDSPALPTRKEEAVLSAINRVIKGSSKRHMGFIADLFDGDDRFLLAFRETDHYV